MPRITKADLTATLDASRRYVEILEQNFHKEQIQNGSLRVALHSADARVELLEKENKALKAERGQGARSRSPRRDAVSAAATHCVLRLVQHFERDAVIDEQRETIAKQQREIASLRRGDGPIGEVLLHNWTQSPVRVTDFTMNTLKAQTTPVNTTMASLQRLVSAASELSLWGGVSPSLERSLSPVVRIYA
jgi:hypothetical protein